MEACVGSMEPSAPERASRLAWKWILEKLVDLPDFGVAFINEVITTHVTDIEEPHCRSLLETVALRNLEEMVLTSQIDSDAIPLLKALTGLDLGPEIINSFVKQRFSKDLVLRVQTEVVLSVLRKDVDAKEKDWACYEWELKRVFGEAEEDNRLLDRKRELSALLKAKNQTTAIVAAYFQKYSLNKLRNDLYSFIDEKRESFKTMFLDQLSRDFLDANGTPFPEELGKVEKSMKVDANATQDPVGTVNVENLQVFAGKHINEDRNLQKVGQNLMFDVTGSPGKKRLRRKLLPIQADIGDVEPDEVQEGSAGIKKSRKVSPTSVFNPLKVLLHQGVSESAISRFSPQSGCFPVKHGVELVKQISSLKRGEEAVSAPRDIGSKFIRSCSPPVHASMSMEGAKVPTREPGRTNRYVTISDVESDVETQVVKRLSSDYEDDPIEDCEDVRQKKADQPLSENGSDRGHSQKIAGTEVVKKKSTTVQSERKIIVDSKKNVPTASREAKISQRGDNEKFVTKNGPTPQDTQDIYDVDFLEVGSDGHEDVCHTCGLHGELLCCDGCPISMHFNCIEVLGLRLPKRKEDWYCPVCMSLTAAREAAEAEMAAAVAKGKLKSFQESIKRRSSSEGNLLHHPKQEKTVKQSILRVNSLQPEELDRASKPQQQSGVEPKLRHTGGQDSDPPKASFLPTVLRRAVHHLNKLSEQDPENTGEDSLLEDRSQSKRVASFGQGEGGKISNDIGSALRVNEGLLNASPKSLLKNGAGSIRDGSAKSVSDVEVVREPHKLHSSHDQEDLGSPFAASGLVKIEREPFSRFSKKKGPEFESGEKSAEQCADGPEPGSGAAGRGEIGDDRDHEDQDEHRAEKSEYLNLSPFFSGRRKITGLRRKRLPWTREEEHALKEGVKRFSYNGAWGFQWKRILEFGQGRFDPSRTDVDLKDKWRNLVKGAS